MRKFLLFVILFSVIVYVSYKHSGRVYNFYMKTYYDYMYDKNELIRKAQNLYDDGKYEELKKFITPLLKIYPADTEISKIAAFNYLKLGETQKGAELFAGSVENSTHGSRELIKILKALYESGNYGDLLFFYNRGVISDDVNASFYYAVSLYQAKRYNEALGRLEYAKKNGYIGAEIDYYFGLVYEKKGDVLNAEKYLKSACQGDDSNRDYRRSLLRIYEKTGAYQKGEMLIRRR